MENISLRHWVDSLHGLQKSGRIDHDVLIIGAGGGSDVAQALYEGAAKVTALELNGQVIDLLSGQFSILRCVFMEHLFGRLSGGTISGW